MAHNITHEQLVELGFEPELVLYEYGGDMVYGKGMTMAVFVNKNEVAVGTYWEATTFEGVENEHDLKTLIMLLYGEKRQTNDHRS